MSRPKRAPFVPTTTTRFADAAREALNAVPSAINRALDPFYDERAAQQLNEDAARGRRLREAIPRVSAAGVLGKRQKLKDRDNEDPRIPKAHAYVKLHPDYKRRSLAIHLLRSAGDPKAIKRTELWLKRRGL